LFELGDSVERVDGGEAGRVIEHVDGQGGLTDYVVEWSDGSQGVYAEYALYFSSQVIYDDEDEGYEHSPEWDDDEADSWSDYDSE
jgi:hypothetical protein